PPDFDDLSETVDYFATVLPKDLTFTDDFPVASADELREAVMAGLDASGNLEPYVPEASSAFYRLSAFDVSPAELALAELVRRSTEFVSAEVPGGPVVVPNPPPPPPNGEKTVPVSLRLSRFIPQSLGKDGPNLVIDMGGGKKETAWPFTLLTPSLGPTARFFFGDNRDFSASPGRPGRVNVKIDGAATYDAQMKLKSLAEPKLETWASKTRDFVPTEAEERALREKFGVTSAYSINHAAQLGKPGIPDAWAMPAAMFEELQADVKHVTPPDVKRIEGAGFKQISFDVNVRGWHPGITTPPNVPIVEEIFKIAAVRAKMKGYVRFYDQCKIEVKAEIEGSAFPNEDLSLRVGDKDVLVCSFKAMTINGMPLRHPETGLMYERPMSTCRALRETCDGEWKTADVSSAMANANASNILGSPASLAQPHLAHTLLQIERDAIAAGVPPAAEPVHDRDKKEYKDGYDRGKFIPADQLCARGPSGAYTGLVKIQETSDAAKNWCTTEPTKYTPGTPNYQLCYTGYIAGVTTVCIGARP
ncbi:MAG: hypothetical protein MUF34_35975, partial [Polyangiaceae bacterium]|nr:hypothetical protein [Polyangiaceae bacterium]